MENGLCGRLRGMATARQKAFARLVARGTDDIGQPITLVDAYEAAGYKALTPRNAQRVEACRLMASRTVSELIEHERVLLQQSEKRIQQKQEVLVLRDSERVLEKLRDWMDGITEATNSEIRAAELLGKSAGLFQTNINVETKTRSVSEIESLLEAKLAALTSHDEGEESIDDIADVLPLENDGSSVH